MTRSLIALSLLAITPLVAYEDNNNHVSFTGEYLLQRRLMLGDRDIVNDTAKPQPCSPCTNFTTLKTKSLVRDFDFEPGYRVKAELLFSKRWSLEGSYTWYQDWVGESHREGDGTLSFPFRKSGFDYDFTNADRATAHYRSAFQTAEFNFWRTLTPRRADYFSFSWILGLRYVHLEEHFRMGFYKGSDHSEYKIETINYMGGVQAGFNLQLNPYWWMRWEFTPKFGILYGHAKLKTFLGDYNDTVVLHHFDDTDHHGLFYVGAPLTLAWQVFNRLDIHVGYEFTYLNGVALAPEQISKGTHEDSGDDVDMRGQMLIHGLIAGLTLSF